MSERVHVYTDEEGEPLFRVRIRGSGKGKSVSQSAPHDGRWKPGLNGARRVPYNLPSVIAAAARGDVVYITEGEKDADALTAEGLVATTNPGGAGHWLDEYTDYLRGAGELRVVQDRDPVGRRHAAAVAASGERAGLRVVRLRPAEGKDVSDHLAAGRTVDELEPVRPSRRRATTTKRPKRDGIRQGERNPRLTQVAGALRRQGLPEPGLAAALLGVNEALCDPPLPKREVREIAKSVARYDAAAGRRIVVTSAADVKIEPVRFLVPQRVPLGALTSLVGVQGTGKSTLATLWAALASRGALGGDVTEPVTTLLVSYEDHAATTIVPRLIAADADRRYVKLLTAERDGGQRDLIGLPDDLDLIRGVVRESRARLLVIDPVTASLGSGVDTHRDAAVRGVLAPLAQLAEEEGLAVLGLMHFTKSGEANALARASGSLAFTAAPRSVLAFAYAPEDEDAHVSGARVLAHAKSNVGPIAPSLAYDLVPKAVPDGNGEYIGTSRLEEVGEHTASANDLLAPPQRDDDRSAGDEAVALLRAELADGPKLVAELRQAAQIAAVGWRTVERAKARLGVVAEKSGGSTAPWRWRLPTEEDTKTKRRKHR